IDVSAFVTNLTDEEYLTYVSGLWPNGIESGQIGMPRMYGARIRYNFDEN
ncbi:MAG: TonB-dependent receptor, partial [Halioglobus sp.]|nr:TonB-dependent receptor [Halioglobus sp.]